MQLTTMKNFDRITGFYWWYYYVLSYFKGTQQNNYFSEIEKYLFFIGYPRSGHSLIGSLLDAHPNIIISNELNALHFFKKNYARRQIFYFILKNSKNYGKVGRHNSDYSYVVPNQWQGSFTKLKLIGDKKGGKSSSILEHEDKLNFICKIESISRANLKIVHVIRNPFDNVSTMVLRQVHENGKELSEELVEKKIKTYLSRAKTNAEMMALVPDRVHTIHLEDFIANPKEELTKLFTFLELKPTLNYLNDCASIVWGKTNLSRNKMPLWNNQRKEEFYNSFQQYNFLKRYTF